jgi:hypothetical protein
MPLLCPFLLWKALSATFAWELTLFSYSILFLTSHLAAYWRQAGMTYLDYLSVSGNTLRNSLKEPARSRAAARASFFYNKAVGPASTATKSPVQGGVQKA